MKSDMRQRDVGLARPGVSLEEDRLGQTRNRSGQTQNRFVRHPGNSTSVSSFLRNFNPDVLLFTPSTDTLLFFTNHSDTAIPFPFFRFRYVSSHHYYSW